MKKFLTTLFVIALSMGLSSVASAELIYLSTTTDATLGGQDFEADDVVCYNSRTGTASIYFDHSKFSDNEDIDAVSVLSNGNILLSTEADATIGTLDFTSGDLVEYDFAGAGTASLFFDHNLFDGKFVENIDAASVRDGNLYLSTVTNATLLGQAFDAEDLVLYNIGSNTASIYFDYSEFSLNEDIDAVSVLSNGNIILSTEASATIGTLNFTSGDLVEFDLGDGTASLFFNGDLFDGTAGENIDAVSVVVPIPSAVWLLGSAFIGLIGLRRKCRE